MKRGKTSASVRGRIVGPWYAALAALLVAACGSRTGLLLSGVPEEEDSGIADTGTRDGTLDGTQPGFDAFFPDNQVPPPPPPPIDASRPDVPVPNDCPDADSTLIYLLDQNQGLHSFYPPTLEFKDIAQLKCPSSYSPYSMAVDRKGKAYSVFDNGSLFEISVATAACIPSTFAIGQQGFTTFGMGFSGDNTSETLYVAEDPYSAMQTGPSKGLASIDTTTLQLSFVNPFVPPLEACELTGTGDGRLFAYCVGGPGAQTGPIIAQIDAKTAQVIGQNPVQVGGLGDAFAFAFWGGSFWIFTSSDNTTSTVTQYDLDTLTETTVSTVNASIVGAGVSTCAPR